MRPFLRIKKTAILKLIQVLIEAADSTPFPRNRENQIKTFTQEIISKHALMALVKQQADELDALRRLGLNLTSSLDLQTVLDAIVDEAMRLVKHSQAAHIFLYSKGKLEFGASLTADNVRNKPISLPRPNGLTYRVANSAEAIIVTDVSSHPVFKDAPIKWEGSIVGIPMKAANDIVGVMNLSRDITGNFTKSELRLLGLLADQAAVAISNARLHKMVSEQANTDSLTGLPNRRALDERLQEEVRYAARTGNSFSVVMMDLNGFKSVNDKYGHAVGDDLLRSVFNYLAQGMRSSDFLARYGGDELALIMREAGLEKAQTVTSKVIELIEKYEYPMPAEKIKLGITAGIAVYPIHSRNAGDLLRAADAALYQAKKHNRGRYILARGATGPLNPISIQPPKG